MQLPILLSDIHFGERDALHEFMKQDKQDIAILDNSFVIPPRVKIEELSSGARYFVVGPKGSGKTTLLWHLKRRATAAVSKFVLFKSEIRKEDRDRLAEMVGLIIVEDQKKLRTEADYKSVWEWYLLKNIFALISKDDILDGVGIYMDIKRILDIRDNKVTTVFDNFHVESTKGKIKLGFGHGALKSEISAEIEARRRDDKIDFLDLIRLVQSFVTKIKLKDSCSVRLYIDELEFFLSQDGDGDRDRRLVRDLIFATYYANTLFSKSGQNIAILASLRSEILNSIITNNQEVEKIIDAFGVKLNWFNGDTETHRVLDIFENKIKYSEVEMTGDHSPSPWTTYFPAKVETKSTKSYLLDLGLHRPRGVLLRLMAALEAAGEDDNHFKEDHFINSENIFGRLMLQEFTEEMSAFFDEKEREWILSLFRGNAFGFYFDEVKMRIYNAPKSSIKISPEEIMKLLYRIGMIGNQFNIMLEKGEELRRNLWSFRGDFDPILTKRFVLHQSIRKVLQTV